MTVVDAGSVIDTVRWRQHVTVTGAIHSIRVTLWAEGCPTLECTVYDGTGGIVCAFLGRSHIGGLVLGTQVEMTGRVVEARGRLVLMNPVVRLLGPRH